MGVLLLVLIFVILTNSICSASGNNYIETAGMLYLLKIHFLSPWVCLLYSNKSEEDDRVLFNIHKELANKHPILIASMPFRYYFNTFNRPSFIDSSPLHAITNADELARKALPGLINNPSMYKALWILFAPSNFSFEEYFDEINIPINTLFLVAGEFNATTRTIPLVEIYRVAPHLPLQIIKYGNWSEAHGLFAPNLNLQRRRRNLTGVIIKTLYLNEDLYARGKSRNGSWNEGIFKKVWKQLEETLHFKTDYITTDQVEVGGSNGMIKDLKNKRADAALGIIAMTPERAQIVDFAIPVLSSSYAIYMRHQDSVMSLTGFTKTFDIYTWICLIIHLCLFIFGGALCYWFAPFQNAEDFYSYTFFVYASICQQGCRDPKRPWALRILIFFSYLGAMVLNTAYCSSLISSLTVADIQPFRTLEDFLNNGAHHVSCVRNSAEETIFYGNNSKQPLHHLLKDMMAPVEENPTTVREALLKICTIRKFAFIGTQAQVEPNIHDLPCKIFSLNTFVRVELTFAFVRGFPYLTFINKVIKEKLETGIINHFLNDLAEPENIKQMTVDAIDINDIVPFLLILLSGVILSMVFTLCEYIFHVRGLNTTRRILDDSTLQNETNENSRPLPFLQ